MLYLWSHQPLELQRLRCANPCSHIEAGDIVIIDNLSSYKGDRVWRMIRAAGARLLFVPAYSPDLNPIEQPFAKLKTLLRKAEARTVEALWKTVANIIPTFQKQECAKLLPQHWLSVKKVRETLILPASHRPNEVVDIHALAIIWVDEAGGDTTIRANDKGCRDW